MGLDQYAYAQKPVAKGEVETPTPYFHYWRKHYALDEWMFATYQRKAPWTVIVRLVKTALFRHYYLPSFSVLITSGDLERLERDLRADRINGYIGQKAADLDFVAKARSFIEAGMTISYRSEH